MASQEPTENATSASGDTTEPQPSEPGSNQQTPGVSRDGRLIAPLHVELEKGPRGVIFTAELDIRQDNNNNMNEIIIPDLEVVVEKTQLGVVVRVDMKLPTSNQPSPAPPTPSSPVSALSTALEDTLNVNE